MVDMQELIARLEAAEAGGVELDYLIDEALSEWRNIGGGFAVHKVTGERRRSSFDYSAPVSTSLDAALALAERLGLDGFHTVYAALMNWKAHDPRGPASQTLPLALCIAILKAKAQGEGG